MGDRERKALCCICGSVRTCKRARNHREENYWLRRPVDLDWSRETGELKCQECGRVTTHALLHPEGNWAVDHAEMLQHVALGGSHPRFDGDTNAKGRSRVRDRYRQSNFPRNPNLNHRFYIADAQKVWDEGRRDVIALCGAPDTIERDPKTWGTAKADANREQNSGYLVAEQLSDIEYTDLDTGLEWIDMDCVDCCRVSNNNRRDQRRELMTTWLKFLCRHPERVPDDHVEALIQIFEAIPESANRKDADR